MNVCERHGRVRCFECAEVEDLKAEVERLRAALEKIANFQTSDCPYGWALSDIARNALNESEKEEQNHD